MRGHCSIVNKSSAYDAKGPGFKNQVEEENLFVSLCINMFCKKDEINKRAPIGANL